MCICVCACICLRRHSQSELRLAGDRVTGFTSTGRSSRREARLGPTSLTPVHGSKFRLSFGSILKTLFFSSTLNKSDFKLINERVNNFSLFPPPPPKMKILNFYRVMYVVAKPVGGASL